MEKTNFTFVRPSNWIMALVVLAVSFVGLQSASAQCGNATNLNASNIGDTYATLNWTSVNGDVTDHCWTLQVGGIDFACNPAAAVVYTVVCQGDAGVSVSGSDVSYTLPAGSLEPGTFYNFAVVETCDGLAPNVSGCSIDRNAAFQTLDEQFLVTGSSEKPSCPVISPGFTPDGSISVTVADGSTCAGTYTIGIDGPFTTNPFGANAYTGESAGTFSFANAGPGEYTITVYETSDCNPPTDPVEIKVTVEDGMDMEAPNYFLVYDIIGNVVAETGNEDVNLGNVVLPEGSCSYQQELFATAFDACDGALFASDALSVVSNVTDPSTVDPATQIGISNNGTTYKIALNWSVGTTEATFAFTDVSGNSTEFSLTATVEDNIEPVVTINELTDITIPQCFDGVIVTFTVQVDDLCDQSIDASQLEVTLEPDGTTIPVFATGPQGNIFLYVLEVSLADAGKVVTATYTDAAGNEGIGLSEPFNIVKAAEDLPPVVIAADENVQTPNCSGDVPVAYSFQVIDDCTPIDLNDLTFDDGGSDLAISFTDIDPDNPYSAFVEVTGFVDAGSYVLGITYQDVTVDPLLVVVQNANQQPDIQLPGNLNFTIPVCEDTLTTTFAVQVGDDCTQPADLDVQFFLGGDEIFPTFTNIAGNASGYYEFTEELTAALNGDFLLVTATDADGAFSAVDAAITVTSQPDNWAPIIIYPSQDINVELDPCEEPAATIIFEVTATDNCDGDLVEDAGLEVSVAPAQGIGNAFILPSPGGDTYVLVAEPGAYQVLMVATDAAGNERQEDFFVVVTQDPAPITNVACNNFFNVTLDDNCEAVVDAEMALTGNLGCLTNEDFKITVVDSDPSNGPIVDECGTFNYKVEQSIGTIQGFEGPFAPSEWTLITSGPFATAAFTNGNTELELTSGNGAFIDDPLDDAMAIITMPAAGALSFDYDFVLETDIIEDIIIFDLNGNEIFRVDDGPTGTTTGSGSISEQVQAGWVLMITLEGDGFTTGGVTSVLTISNFGFESTGVVDGGFTCWGEFTAEDKTDPIITCPDDTDMGMAPQEAQLYSGDLLATDPTFDPGVEPCLFEQGTIENDPGDRPYDTFTFTVDKEDVYVFDLTFEDLGGTGVMGALYQNGFDVDSPCENIVAQNFLALGSDAFVHLFSDLFAAGGLTFPNGNNPRFRVQLPLKPNVTYTLMTTAGDTGAFGDFQWTIYSYGDGRVNELGVTQGTEVRPLICTDVDAIYNNPASLGFVGGAVATDNCGSVDVTFSDELIEGTDCSSDVIIRTFTATDEKGNSVSCEQEITIRKPAVEDLILPPYTAFLECDEGFPLDENDNPHPSVTGYPFIQTAFGTFDLDQTYCNLGASYSDEPRVNICEGAYKLRREWNVFDWCDPVTNFTYNQVIKVGDFTAPEVDCPKEDYDWDGVYDLLTYSVGPFDCTASFHVPLPGISDNCSAPEDLEVYTKIITDIEVPVYNEWGQETGTETETIVVATIGPDDSRYVSGIPVGSHRFEYTVGDLCGNETVAECDFRVVDAVAPIAVCDDDLNISLGGNGVAIVYAADIDEGSSDNCSEVRLEVRRFDLKDPATCTPVFPNPTLWKDYVEFNCCDIGNLVRVELQVWDDANQDGIVGGPGDNSNICWLDVTVEDKLPPLCIPPHNKQIDCNNLPFAFDPNSGEHLHIFGDPMVDDNCPGATVEELSPITSGLDECGYGTLIRRFRATDAVGNVSTPCTQTIFINEVHDYEIKFPKDAANYVCGDPMPDTIEVFELACDLLAVSVDDEFFSASGDECYKIFRTYRVINWCEYDGISDPVVIGRDEDCDGVPGDEDIWVLRRSNGSVFLDADNDENNTNPFVSRCFPDLRGHHTNNAKEPRLNSVGYWEYTQHIKVYDDIDPIVTFDVAEPFCSLDNVDCDATVSVDFVVDENCTPDDLTVTVNLDAFADKVDDGDITASVLSGEYPNYTISGEFPIGDHQFVVEVEDGCGNFTIVKIPFSVIDCKAPAPICINGLAVELMPTEPGTDADGDGDVDTGAMGIWASDFIASDINDCTPFSPTEYIRYAIYRVSDFENDPDLVPSPDQTGIVLTCDDDATLLVRIYAFDGAGNFDFCETYVLVQDNMFGLCVGDGGASIAGLIETVENEPVAGVEVNLSGNTDLTQITTDNGMYAFSGLELAYDYTVTPQMDIDYLNGVSTFDLVLISKHILGLQPLPDAYKMIAADVDNSGSISILDLIHARKAILNITTDFPNNTSWRFVDASYDFLDASNPWAEEFPEIRNFNDLATDQLDANFYAVKIGDVNGNAVVNANMAEDRDVAGVFEFQVADAALVAGNEYQVEFTAADIATIEGYQFTLNFDNKVLELVDVVYGAANEANFGMKFVEEGVITTSWNGEASAEEVLFTLVLRANTDAQLSELLNVSSRYTRAEAYTTASELMDVAINFGQGVVANAGFELYQNQPNPFKGQTMIGFNLPEDSEVTMTISDVAGRVLKLVRGEFAKGYNTVNLDSKDLPTVGVLYYTVETANHSATRRMVIIE